MRHTDRFSGWVILTVAICFASCTISTETPSAGNTPPPPATRTPIPTATLTPTPIPTPTRTPRPGLEKLQLEIIAVYPHDPTAYTEGLVYDNGLLYESTGSYPASTLSTLREVKLKTGEVLRTFLLQPEFYAEGLALINGQLVQLTWQQSTAFLYDRSTFESKSTFSYDGEGWGLCFDGTYFFMSDGTPTITVRDPGTFAPISTIEVQLQGEPVLEINELECVGEELYANVWHTENILRTDKNTGRVNGVIDASGLLMPDEATQAGPEGWLNGIAYNADKDTFYITGKLWPKLFEVRFVPAEP